MNSFIQTASGRAFDYSAVAVGAPLPIHLPDIAHALAHLCRYCGHALVFLSVAEHSLMVEEQVRQLGGTDDERRWALIHDATEAYMADIPSPLKHTEFMAGYREFEKRLGGMIAEHFRLDPEMPAIVKQADMDVLECERRAILGPSDRPWEILSGKPANIFVRCLSPQQARHEFLHACRSLDL